MLYNTIKIAWRNLQKNKVYTTINVLGLSIGISACLVIFLVVKFELSFDNFHPDKERIYRLVSDVNSEEGWQHAGNVPDPLPIAVRQEVSGLAQVAIFHNYTAKVSIPGHGGHVKKIDAARPGEGRSDIIIAEPEYFDIFQQEWLAGNKATALQEPFKVVLTRSKAEKYFGSQPLDGYLDRTIIYNDSLPLTVSGIVADFPENTDFYFNDFISFATVKSTFLRNDFTFDNWSGSHRDTQVFVKLGGQVSDTHVQAALDNLVRRHLPNVTPLPVFKLQSLADIHVNLDYDDIYSRKVHLPTIYSMLLIAGFILLLAIVNFINLATAQSMRRSKEIGVRKVCGSSRLALMLQFLSETFMLTLTAVLLSLASLYFLLYLLRSFIPDGALSVLFSAQAVAFLLGLALVTAFLAGFYPAHVLSSFVPVISLKGTDMQKYSSRAYLRRGLVVFQFTISLVLTIGTLVVNHQMRYMRNKKTGFSKEGIITIQTNDFYPAKDKDLLASKIRQISGVKMVSVSQAPPAANEHWSLPLTLKGDKPVTVACQLEWADQYFIPLFQMTLIAGRNLQSSDTLREVIINAACAKAMGFVKPADALNKSVEAMNETGAFQRYPIVGVLADFHSQSLQKPITPFFIASSGHFSRNINVKLASKAGSEPVLHEIAAYWKEIYPNEKFDYRFFDETVARFYENERKTSLLMNVATALSMFISCIGLLGMTAFTAQQRVREIAIRKVLGATTGNMLVLLSREMILLIVTAIFIASPIAWYFLQKWLENFSYNDGISWASFLMASLLTLLIALTTVSYQAVRAAVANPLKNLKTD